MGESNVVLLKRFQNEIGPFSETLSGVDDQALISSADNICICTLECELGNCQGMRSRSEQHQTLPFQDFVPVYE